LDNWKYFFPAPQLHVRELKRKMEYLKKLLEKGIEVSKSRIPSGSPFIYDQVNNIMYQKWVMNCISMLKDDAPDHVEQIRSIYDPKYNLINQFERIFGIVSSAVEYISHEPSCWPKKNGASLINSRNYS
jgi:hypothetical protein